MNDDFKLGCEVLSDGTLILKTIEDSVFQKTAVNTREDLEAMREAVDAALDELDGETSQEFEDSDIQVTSQIREGGLVGVTAAKPHIKTRFKIEEQEEIDALAHMLSQEANLEDL